MYIVQAAPQTFMYGIQTAQTVPHLIWNVTKATKVGNCLYTHKPVAAAAK